jgi:hypothetical protein
MRIALHVSGEVGRRTGRILLGEADLVALGLYGHPGGRSEDRRTTAIRELTGYEVLVTDAADGPSLARIAIEDGLHVVLAADDEIDDAVAAAARLAGLTILVGSALGPGIAEALAVHEAARTGRDLAVRIAWTVPGSPRRRGVAVPFPDPVGARWGKVLSDNGHTTRQVAPVDGPWAGAVATVTGRAAGRRVQRTVGVADDADHLSAIALAAGALAVASGAYAPGVQHPSSAADAYLAAALRVGMGVAAFTADA